MKNKLNMLIGTWETETRDSAMQIEILLHSGKPKVRAFDKNDGEQFKVTKCTWDGIWLNYLVHVPSTGHKSKNKVRVTSTGKMVLELTIHENWRRVKKLGHVAPPRSAHRR